MSIDQNAELSALLNVILTSSKIILDQYSDDIAENALYALHDLKNSVVTIMDWNGSALTNEHKIHDVGFYFIGRNNGPSDLSKKANAKGIEFERCYNAFINQCKDIIGGEYIGNNE